MDPVTYMNLTTGERVTVTRSRVSDSGVRVVDYRRDNPTIVENIKLFEFSKPEYVFLRSYKRIRHWMNK